MTEQIAPGTLYGLGVGPGDPELLTLKAHRLLTTVPVVFAPAGRDTTPGYAHGIVAGYLDVRRQRVEALRFALTRDRAALEEAWGQAAARVAAVCRSGVDAAFVTEGDPLTYSTFAHLYRTIRAGYPDIPVQVVPGITSFAAASAVACRPLVDQEERLAIVPATYTGDELERLFREFDTVVLLKVNTVFERVLDLLERLDLAGTAVYVRLAGRPEQEVHTDIRALRGKRLDYFSLLIVYSGQGALHG